MQRVQWPVAARFCAAELGAAGLGAVDALAAASFGRGRGSGTSANLPAFASGVAVSGATSAALAADGAKLISDGLCTSDAPGMERVVRPGWLGGGAKTPGGGMA